MKGRDMIKYIVDEDLLDAEIKVDVENFTSDTMYETDDLKLSLVSIEDRTDIETDEQVLSIIVNAELQ